MFNYPAYECTWDLFESIPSLEDDSRSVKDVMDEFNEAHPSYAKTRLMHEANGSTRASTD